MNNDCSTCKHYLGGGYCRLNEEAECRDGGGYELWDDGVAAHEDELPEEPPRCVLEELMDALDYIEKLETEKKPKNDDLISRESVVERLREKGKKMSASMFATSSEFDIARIITLECVNEVRNMPAYSKGEDE